jgi:hypothetical protein
MQKLFIFFIVVIILTHANILCSELDPKSYVLVKIELMIQDIQDIITRARDSQYKGNPSVIPQCTSLINVLTVVHASVEVGDVQTLASFVQQYEKSSGKIQQAK